MLHSCAPPPPGPGRSEGEAGGAEASWGEVLGSRAALTGVALFAFQQFTGINAIVYFSSSGERGGGGSDCVEMRRLKSVRVCW